RLPQANRLGAPTARLVPAAHPTDDYARRPSMSRAFNHVKSNVVAYIALFVALGGTSYAATTLRANSVGDRQLKNHSVSAIKLDRNSIGGYVRYWARIS